MDTVFLRDVSLGLKLPRGRTYLYAHWATRVTETGVSSLCASTFFVSQRYQAKNTGLKKQGP
jgi:hypothetical protein